MKTANDTSNGWVEVTELRMHDSSCGMFRNEFKAMLKKSEIVEILDDADKGRYGSSRCTVVMKNGTEHIIRMRYEDAVRMFVKSDFGNGGNK